LSDGEIEEVEECQAVKLPVRYKLFLKECGRSAWRLLYDFDFLSAVIKDLKQKLEDVIEEDGAYFHLPDNAFVFAAYQGAQYHYFVCDQDDPPTFRVYDDGTVEPGAGSFSQYMEETIEDYGAIVSRRHSHELGEGS